MMNLEHRIPPPVVALACGVLIYLLRDVGRASFAWQAYVAALVLAASLAVMISAVRQFRRVETTINPLAPASASTLVQAGVFSFSRNPMYLGLFGVLLAWAIFLGSPAGMAGLLLFVAFMNRFQIRPEERAMAALFGEEYSAYRRRVRRWL